jgi:hypothetical protein
VSDEQLPDPDEDRELEDSEHTGDELGPSRPPPILGPAAGAMLGILVFFVLGDRFSILIRLAIAVVVVGVSAYLSLILARRR